MEKQLLDSMKEIKELQGEHGNWNYDEYSHGLYNGMEFMIAIAEGREPVFKSAPEVWLKDIECPENFTETKREVLISTDINTKCTHNNVTTWNHGYHNMCRDCGERDV